MGDPTIQGWGVAIGYAIAAALAALASARAGTRQQRLLWRTLAVILLLLALNKQLDLQSCLTNMVRREAIENGWYGQHRRLQAYFIAALAAATLGLGAVLAWVLRRADLASRVAAFGTMMIAAFVTLRAASFHHVDEFLTIKLANWSAGSFLEGGGIVLIAAGACAFVRGASGRVAKD